MKKVRTSRFFSVVLSIALVVSLAPSFTWATETPTGATWQQNSNETSLLSGLAQLAQPGQVLRLGTNATGSWEVGGVNFPTLAEAVAAANSGDTITLTGGDINETTAVSIPSSKNIIIDLGGNTVDVSLGDTSKTFITTARGSTLTIKNGTLAGNQDGRAINSSGTLVLQGVALQGFASSGSGGAIYVNEGKVDIADCSFSNNKSLEGGSSVENLQTGDGAVYLGHLGPHNIVRTTFSENSTDASGGALMLASHDQALVQDCTFSKNFSGMRGGAIHVFGITGIDTFNRCTIDGNKVEQVGSGTTFAGSGGGMTIMMTSTGSKTIIKDCTISGNSTYGSSVFSGRGGGIRFYNLSGTTEFQGVNYITGNTAKMGGGIDYTVHNQTLLQLNNALVANNTAVRGGGVWTCPDGSFIAHTTLGGTIVENTASGEPIYPLYQTANAPDPDPDPVDDGDIEDPWRMIKAGGQDIQNEGTDSYDVKTVNNVGTSSVDTRGPAGTNIVWYNDTDRNRYQEGDNPADTAFYTNTDKNFALIGKPDGESWKDYGYQLFITGNTATLRGGGIATNSPIAMGVDEPTKEIDVSKTWDKGENENVIIPDKVLVDLYRIDNGDTDNPVKLDSNVELNAGNNWKHEFTHLPAYGMDVQGNRVEYSYTVQEQEVPGWIAEYKEEDSKVFITNTRIEPVSETLEVEKVIESETATSADETFTFELAPIATQPDNPMPANAQGGKAQATIDHTGKTSFDAITFTQTGNYTYTVREVAGNAAGYTYDTTEYEVTFVVSENEGKLQATKIYKERVGETLVDVEELSFKNTYTVESTTVAGLEVSKTVEGEKPAKDATFDFVLERTDDTYPMPEYAEGSAQLISVEGAGTASFGQITFDEEGTYTYTVREIETNAAGYTYDKAVYTVSYHVVADHNTAKLVVTPTITKDGVAYESSAALAFTNSYKHIPNTADGIVVTKNLVGDVPEHAQDFTFALTPAQPDNPMPQDAVEGKAHISIHGAEAGAFGTITFETPGTYAYTVTEEKGTATGYTYDKAAFTVTYTVTAGEEELGFARAITKAAEGTDATGVIADATAANEVAFTNTFKHTPVQASIPVAKTISGSTPAPEETFAFVLTAEGGNDPLSANTRVEIKGAGTAEFGPITFDAPGTYKYNIEEVLGTAEGYSYDNSVHEVAFTVEEVNGVLQATPSYLRDGQVVQGVSFSNEYTTPSAPVDVVLVKHLLNALINKGEFSFGLYDEQGKQYGETIHTVLDPTLTNPETDQYTSFVEIAFQDLIYYEPGVYKYTIREHTEGTTEVVEGDENNLKGFEPGFYKGGVKYDDKEYPVVVTVLPDDEGKLVANVEYPEAEGDTQELVNEYNEEFIEIDGYDSHVDSGLHEDPTPGPTPEPTPPSGGETTDNTGDNTLKKDDGKKTTKTPATKTVPKTGSVRTEDTNPVAQLALVALVAAGVGVLAFANRRKKE